MTNRENGRLALDVLLVGIFAFIAIETLIAFLFVQRIRVAIPATWAWLMQSIGYGEPLGG